MSAGATQQQPEEDREIAYLAEPRRTRPGLLQFSLDTLLLVMSLVAAALGLLVAVPPLGVWFVLVGSLALVRTVVECRRFLNDGRQVLLGDKLYSFLRSLGYSFLAVVGSLIVFALLSMLAAAVVALGQWIAEGLGGFSIALFGVVILGLILMAGCLAGAGMTFFSIYWTTISPRLTLDRPPPRQLSIPADAPR